jgi:hypothetical protein
MVGPRFVGRGSLADLLGGGKGGIFPDFLLRVSRIEFVGKGNEMCFVKGGEHFL